MGRNQVVGFLPWQLTSLITKSCLLWVKLPLIIYCVWWHVSCRGRKPTIRLRPTLLHKSPQAAAVTKISKKSCNGLCSIFWANIRTKKTSDLPRNELLMAILSMRGCVTHVAIMCEVWYHYVGPLEPKNAKITKKLASYGLLPSVRKMGFTSHFIYLTLSHKTYVLTLFNIIFYFLFIYPTQHDPICP